MLLRACVDTSECGHLAASPFVGEYTKTLEFALLTSSDQLNISINVHNEGNTLEIVGMCCKYEWKLIEQLHRFNYLLFAWCRLCVATVLIFHKLRQ